MLIDEKAIFNQTIGEFESTKMLRKKEAEYSHKMDIVQTEENTVTDTMQHFRIALSDEFAALKYKAVWMSKYFSEGICNVLPHLHENDKTDIAERVTRLIKFPFGHLHLTLIHLFVGVWMMHMSDFFAAVRNLPKNITEVGAGLQRYTSILFAILAANGYDRCEDCGLP